MQGCRHLPRSPRRADSRWKRRCDAGSGYQTTSQELPAKDEGAGHSYGATFWVLETLDFSFHTKTYNTCPMYTISEIRMMEKKLHLMPRLPHSPLPTLRAFTISHPLLNISPIPCFPSRTQIPGKNKLHAKQTHRIRSTHITPQDQLPAIIFNASRYSVRSATFSIGMTVF